MMKLASSATLVDGITQETNSMTMDSTQFITSLKTNKVTRGGSSEDTVKVAFMDWLDDSLSRPGNTEGSRNCYKSYFNNMMKSISTQDFSTLSKNDRSGARHIISFLEEFFEKLSMI